MNNLKKLIVYYNTYTLAKNSFVNHNNKIALLELKECNTINTFNSSHTYSILILSLFKNKIYATMLPTKKG